MPSFKKHLLVCLIITAIAGTLAHFVYDLSGQNFYVGLFFPINESVWEHMKLVFFPMLIISCVIHFRFSNEYPDLNFSLPVSALSGTWLIPVLYYFYSGVLGFSVMPVDIAIFYISVITAFIIMYRLSKKHFPNSLTTLLYGLVILMIAMFMLYTYKPPKLGIFKEPEQHEKNISLSYSEDFTPHSL